MSKEKFFINQINNGYMWFEHPKIEKPITNQELALACINSIHKVRYDNKEIELNKLFNSLSKELKADKKIAKAFLKISAKKIFDKLQDDIKNDPSIIQYALKQDSSVFGLLDEIKQKNKEYIDIVTDSSICLRFFKQSVLEDKETMLYVFNKNCNLFEYASPKIQNDEEICRFIVKKSARSIMYVKNNNVKNDTSIAEKVLNDNIFWFQYCGKEIRGNDIFARKATESCPSNFVYVSKELKRNKNLALKAILDDSMYLEVDEKLRNDSDFIKEALMENIRVEKCIDKEIIESMTDLKWMRALCEKFPNYAKTPELKEMLERKERVKYLEETLQKIDKVEVSSKKPKI